MGEGKGREGRENDLSSEYSSVGGNVPKVTLDLARCLGQERGRVFVCFAVLFVYCFPRVGWSMGCLCARSGRLVSPSPFVFIYVHVFACVGLTFVIMHSRDSMTACVYLHYFPPISCLRLHAKENARFVYVCKTA